MSRLVLGLGLISLLAGCTFEPSGDGGDRCEARCDGADAITCPAGPEGAPVVETCAVACAATPAPHCGALAPSNTAAIDLGSLLPMATMPLALPAGSNYSLNTDTGEIRIGAGPDLLPVPGTVFRLIEPKMALLVVDALTVPADVTLFGFGTRALVVVARGDIDVAGTIDFSPGCTLGEGYTLRCGGPGGGNGGRDGVVTLGCAPGNNGSQKGGGAGGGFGTRGGAGGPGGLVAMSSALDRCGNTAGNPLVPLIGGGGGGAGAPNSLADGGGGGGAIQLSALGRVRVAGSAAAPATIYVGGAGGWGADGNNGGGGGGAGGGIFLEGATIELGEAALIATGGGGGGGRNGSDGAAGRRDGAAAAGGSSSGGGAGGDGAIDSTAAEPGAAGGGMMNIDGGGGGGGGLGRIRLHTPTGDVTVPATTRTQGVLSTGAFPIE
ncbi:MAG: hypothetical protein IPL61_32395 [Myxococcales bacterium]|nr:hypothetical protein [Myxococcales bacterium]